MDITLVSCIYNTPHLITPLFKSFDKYHKNYKKVVVNTSDQDTLEKECDDILDNIALYKKIKLRGFSHGEAVNQALKLIDTSHVLLVDSDIIFYKGFDTILDRMIEGDFALGGEIVGNRGGKELYPRIQPWYCYINLTFLKNNNINFFDKTRTLNSKERGVKIYDIGSTMFEDVVNAGGSIANFKVENKYFKHYEGMSWRTQKYDPNNGDTDIDIGGTHDNSLLYEYGIQIKKQYDEEIKWL
jgi:hypothetical protein